jgi:hypothetical protein
MRQRPPRVYIRALYIPVCLVVMVAFAPSTISASSSQNTTQLSSRKSTRSQSPRRLSDGLDCDVQLYHDFINSEEGANIIIMATMCESRIKYIRDIRAGKYGPVEQSDLRWVMCSNECIVSDSLHQLAMARSRCSCAQVSANTCVTHDFCLENSARLLCTHLGECGHWNCELEDFMCLRNEWDRLYACDALSLRFGVLSFALGVLTLVALL